jgi:hypothetical protein
VEVGVGQARAADQGCEALGQRVGVIALAEFAGDHVTLPRPCRLGPQLLPVRALAERSEESHQTTVQRHCSPAGGSLDVALDCDAVH